MANTLFENGREGFLNGAIDWDGATNMSAALLDLNTADSGNKLVSTTTGSGVSPIVVTTTAAHGYSNGDLVYIDTVGGCTAANGVWKIANVAASTMELTNPITSANATGNGAYTSGGYVVCLGGVSTAGDTWDDFSAAIVGVKQNLLTRTLVNGIADADDVTFTSVTGATVEAVAIFQDTGTETTSLMIALISGKQIVTCNASIAAATTLTVEPLLYGIPNSTVLAFSTNQTATLTAAANAGDRALTVASTTVTAGARALAPATGSGLPVTPNGGNIVVTWDNGVNKIFKL